MANYVKLFFFLFFSFVFFKDEDVYYVYTLQAVHIQTVDWFLKEVICINM